MDLAEQFPPGEVIVTVTSIGDLWLIAGPCRAVFEGDPRRVSPDRDGGIVYRVGRVMDTEEPVLSYDGEGPVDGVTVWIESQPGDHELLEDLESRVGIAWCAEPELYGIRSVE